MSDKLARRLVVTGHDQQGRSRVASDAIVRGEAAPGQPGVECSMIWGSDQKMRYPDNGTMPAFATFFPPPEGFRLLECYFPPGYTPAADISTDLTPGFADTLVKGARPGMHRTSTADLVIVLEGRCILHLDEEDVALSAGDMVVQSGTIHAWSNPYETPCRFLAAVLGAENDLCD